MIFPLQDLYFHPADLACFKVKSPVANKFIVLEESLSYNYILLLRWNFSLYLI